MERFGNFLLAYGAINLSRTNLRKQGAVNVTFLVFFVVGNIVQNFREMQRLNRVGGSQVLQQVNRCL